MSWLELLWIWTIWRGELAGTAVDLDYLEGGVGWNCVDWYYVEGKLSRTAVDLDYLEG